MSAPPPPAPNPPDENPRVACDAMCGGVARWLRLMGVDATWTPGIDDGDLVRHALDEQRVVVSSDGPLFDRRVFTTGELPGVRLPVGLKLDDQVAFVVPRLGVQRAFPRCAACNGELFPVRRQEIGDRVPARTLVWQRRFYQCAACGKVYWEGTHWRRIGELLRRVSPLI